MSNEKASKKEGEKSRAKRENYPGKGEYNASVCPELKRELIEDALDVGEQGVSPPRSHYIKSSKAVDLGPDVGLKKQKHPTHRHASQRSFPDRPVSHPKPVSGPTHRAEPARARTCNYAG